MKTILKGMTNFVSIRVVTDKTCKCEIIIKSAYTFKLITGCWFFRRCFKRFSSLKTTGKTVRIHQSRLYTIIVVVNLFG